MASETEMAKNQTRVDCSLAMPMTNREKALTAWQQQIEDNESELMDEVQQVANAIAAWGREVDAMLWFNSPGRRAQNQSRKPARQLPLDYSN